MRVLFLDVIMTLDTTHKFDMLGKVQDKSSALYLTIEGFKRTMMKHLGLSNMYLVMHDAPEITRRNGQDVENFPYSWFKLNSFQIIPDQSNLKAIGRHSSSMSIDEFTNAYLAKNYMFPVNLSIEFHYLTNDIQDMFVLIPKIGIISALGKFSFMCSTENCEPWQVFVYLDSPDISFPTAALEATDKPAAYDITFTFKIQTKAGVSKMVPKINNAGTVTSSVQTKTE